MASQQDGVGSSSTPSGHYAMQPLDHRDQIDSAVHLGPLLNLGGSQIQHVATHHLTYSGAGRFWKPPEHKGGQRTEFLKRKRRDPPVRPGNAASAPVAHRNSPTSSSPSLSIESRQSGSDDVNSVASERNNRFDSQASIEPQTTSAAGVYKSQSTQDTLQFQPLAQRIADEERKKKTILQLWRLHELEEAKAAEFRATDEDAPTEDAAGPPLPQNDSNGRNLELPGPPSVQLDPPEERWHSCDLIKPPLADPFPPDYVRPNADTGSEDKAAGEGSMLSALDLSPSILAELPSTFGLQNKIRSSEQDSCQSSVPPAGFAHELEAQNIYVRSRYGSGEVLHRSVTTVQAELSEQHSSHKPLSADSPAWQGGSCVKDGEAEDPMIHGDSLFADLNKLKRSLPSRNTRPQLLSKSGLFIQPEVRKANQTGSARGASEVEECTAASFPEIHCELSASPSVILHPVPEPSSNRSVRHYSDSTEYNTLPHEPFPLKSNLSSARDIYAAPRSTSACDDLPALPRGTGEPISSPHMRMNIEPTIDPRTERPYVNVNK